MLRQAITRSLSILANRIKPYFSKLCMVDQPEGDTILVIAPHPDDDVIGCGGTIRLHILSGHVVYIVYLTDGEKGIKDFEKVRTIEIRKQEASHAAGLLGVPNDNLFFLHLSDGNVINESGNNKEFKTITDR